MTTEKPHGPVCIGLDAGCPDCVRLHAVGVGEGSARAVIAPPETPAELGARLRAMKESALSLINAIDEWETIESEPIDTIDDVETLAAGILNDRDARRSVLGPELAAVLADSDLERGALPRPSAGDLERWNRAARDVPGPMGRCIRILLGEVARLSAEGERQRGLLRRVRSYAVVDPLGNPASAVMRMVGIETDIDDCLEGRPPRPGLDLFGKLTPETVRNALRHVDSDETDDS